MVDPLAWRAHGLFGVAPFESYALVTFAGSWNSICLKIFAALLQKHLPAHSSGRNRCCLVDCREWGMLSPDGHGILTELSRFLGENYATLDVAFILSPRNLRLGKYILETNHVDPKNNSSWEFFIHLDEAIDWLRRRHYLLPHISWEDFPPALPPEAQMNGLRFDIDGSLTDS